MAPLAREPLDLAQHFIQVDWRDENVAALVPQRLTQVAAAGASGRTYQQGIAAVSRSSFSIASACPSRKPSLRMPTMTRSGRVSSIPLTTGDGGHADIEALVFAAASNPGFETTWLC